MTREDLQRLFPAVVHVEVATDADENEGSLYPDELALMASMVPARRREFAAGRNVARRALVRLGFQSVALPRRAGSLDVEWPEGSTGSISHTRGLRVAACTHSSDFLSVGIDVEEAGPLGDDITDAICRPEEITALLPLSAPRPSDWPRVVFAMKEAAYKALYPLSRRMLSFHDMRVDVSVASRSYRAEVLEPSVPGLDIVGRFTWDEAYVAAGAILVVRPLTDHK